MKVINILLVEDDALDVIDVRRTLDKLDILYNLSVAHNGEEGIKMLEQHLSDGQPLPDLLLVDINMPRMNGFEFLERVRGSDQLSHLKCFILTTSGERIDRLQAEKLNVSGYLIKPLKLNNPGSLDAFNLTIDILNMKK